MEVSTPQISKRSGPSVVWLIPLITILVGGWLIIKTLSEQGPEATISFKTAEGIEVGSTRVKYKNVDVGVIEKIRFSDDLSHVILTAKFNQGTENFLRRNTRFWVVRPQLSLRGVSGLGTLISGAYIEIDPGPGAEQRHFIGLEKQPVVKGGEAGKKIVLITNKLGSLDTGSPVYYQGIMAGEVLGYELGNDRKSVYVYSFIKDPFDQLVRGNTRFWNVSGMDVSINADGLNIQTESLQSLMFGGIAFETPDTLEKASDDVENLVFTLFDDYQSIQEQAYTKKIQFVLYFDNSVRGLHVGAPVEFKGIKVGSVLDIRLEFDSKNTTFLIPILVEIEPERIIERNQEITSPYQTLNTLIERGLRARLQTGSLLTGQLFVELGMYPDSPVALRETDLPYPELPTIAAANFEAITASIEGFVAKLDEIKIDEIGEELLNTLQGANKIINAPEIQDSVTDLRGSIESLRNILQKIDESDVKAVMASAQGVLEKLNKTLDLANDVLKPNSALQYNAIQLTDELEETARAIRSLVETLERHPQSLIFGKDAEGE